MTASGDDPRKSFTGWVAVEGNRIVLATDRAEEAEAYRAAATGLREVDCRGKVLMPGLVNTATWR